MRRIAGLVAALCLLFAPARLGAQSADATLTGAVKDSSGASIPGATITARNTATNETRVAVAGADGLYRVTSLPRGTYEVRAELEGFRTVAQSGVLLTVGDTVRLDFTLE